MEIVEKFVEFDQYCKRCKHEQLPESEDPCFECLANPVNVYSHKPVNFEAAEKSRKNSIL